MRFVLALAVLVSIAACTAASPAPVPTLTPTPESAYTGQPGTPDEPLEPLRGVALTGPTGLRLLVGGTVYDIDHGTRHRLAGLPATAKDDDVAIEVVGRDVVLTLSTPRQEVYVVRKGSTAAARVVVAPSPGSGTLRWNGDSALRLGDRRFPLPSSISLGRPRLTVSPDLRYAAVEYGEPAWPGPRQRLDVWVLDLRDGRWTQLPSMPVAASLKLTGLAWAGDGRLVLLGSFDGTGSALAVWRPGEPRLALRRTDFAGGQIAVL